MTGRKIDGKGRAGAHLGLDADVSPVLEDDGVGARQPEAGSSPAGGEIGVEDSLEVLLRDPHSLVLDEDLTPNLIIAARSHRDDRPPREPRTHCNYLYLWLLRFHQVFQWRAAEDLSPQRVGSMKRWPISLSIH